MPDTDPFDDVSPEREPFRAGLALVCILAVVFASAALPALSLGGAVGSAGSSLVPFEGQPDGAGNESTLGERNVTPGDDRLTPSEGSMRPSQQSGATPTGSADDATGSGPGGQTGAGELGNRTGAGEFGNRTGGGDTGNQTVDGDASGQADDGEAGNRPDDGDTGGQTSGDGTGNQTADGDASGQSGDGEAGDGTSGDGTSGDGTSGDGTSGDGTSGDGTSGNGTSGDGTSGDGTSGNGTSGDGTSGDGTSGDGTSGDGTSGDGTSGDGTSGDGTSDSDGTGEGSDNATADDEQGDSYDVTLNRSATAGAVVEVTVTRDGAPAEGVQVSFNGDPIGTTDEAGTVVGRVPYEDQLTITLESEAQQSLSAPRSRGDRLFAVSAPPPAQVSNENFTVDTNVSLSLSGPVATGRTVTLTATIDGVPVRSAAVTIDGERVGRTDGSGTATVQLPAEPGNYTIGVSRDAVSGTRTVTLDGLSVATESTLPLALPGTGLAVTVTAGGEPVPNATVVLDGEAVAETDGNGTARLTLPFAGSATVTVRQYGQASEAVVGGLFVNLAGVLAGALALAGGAGYLLRRRGVSRATVAGWLRRATQLAVNGLLWLAAALDSALASLRTRITLTVAALRAFLARRRTPAELWAALRAWVVAKVTAARASADAAATAARNADPRTDEPGPADERTAIRAAWGRFVEHVSLRRTDTATPGEIAAHAVETDDLPAEAVEALREAYRAVEYGQYDPGDHVAAVERAIERIERSAAADAGAEDGGDTA